MNTIGSHSSLGDLISYNTPAQPAAAQTTVATAQQSAQATIVAGLDGGSANAIPSEYYVARYSAILSTLAPSLTFSQS